MACLQFYFAKREDDDITNKKKKYYILKGTSRAVMWQCMKTHANNSLLFNKHYSLWLAYLKHEHCWQQYSVRHVVIQGADKSLARPGRKQATATKVFEFHIYYL